MRLVFLNIRKCRLRWSLRWRRARSGIRESSWQIKDHNAAKGGGGGRGPGGGGKGSSGGGGKGPGGWPSTTGNQSGGGRTKMRPQAAARSDFDQVPRREQSRGTAAPYHSASKPLPRVGARAPLPDARLGGWFGKQRSLVNISEQG